MLGKVFCFSCAWGMLFFGVLSFLMCFRKGLNHIKKLHQVPCARCEYFTNDYRLKCTVQPIIACSEDAISCRDFAPRTSTCNACQSSPKKRISLRFISKKLRG